MTPEQFRARLPDRGILCGLDFGTKRIGMAFSDSDWQFAGPDSVLKRTKQTADFAVLSERLVMRQAKGIVLGMPLNMDGSGGPAAQRVRAFGRALEAAFPLPVMLWDERLTSEAAQEAMAEAGVPRARWPEKIDAHAAALILRGAMEALTRSPPMV
ncbi:Holliday junction resolvase RuvX [Pacificimonas flava]|uniref:Putative pre-16S rRNA nuclease n=1 Tax=Pacificimonas flava TaxID=1234595 RepID=M2TN12_9SPHN|nr:Holliday junction resolvase RuvX [Pacificimonas flava]EMD83136.1 Putative Holliday junction resolvase [Pacificimonas flava]MBB5280293.1 putative Holliday junction resolvase [Pacificimonas flava]